MKKDKERLNLMNKLRVQRYREVHKGEFREFSATISSELFDKITLVLEQEKKSKRAFIESAIKYYLRKKSGY